MDFFQRIKNLHTRVKRKREGELMENEQLQLEGIMVLNILFISPKVFFLIHRVLKNGSRTAFHACLHHSARLKMDFLKRKRHDEREEGQVIS